MGGAGTLHPLAPASACQAFASHRGPRLSVARRAAARSMAGLALARPAGHRVRLPPPKHRVESPLPCRHRRARGPARAAATALVLLGLAAPAAEPPSDALHWRLLGPFRGGRVLAVSGVPGEPLHFYFGSVNGGVWETVNAGRTWRPIFDGQGTGAIGALAVAPSDPHVLYVGTGEADMRSDIAHGDGLYRSQDGGASWAKLGLSDSRQIGRIIVDPTDPRRLFVAALGHAYGPNEQRGVYRSVDGGQSFEQVLYRDADTGAIDLAFKPGDPQVIYAALWQTRRPPWHIYPPANGPGGGLYVSRDGGGTWQQVAGSGFPAGTGRIGLAVAPAAPDRVYAIVDAEEGGLYRSDDAGRTWSRTSDDKRIWQRGWYFGGLTVEPRDADVVYACNTALYRSTDGGHQFVPVKGAPGGDDYHTLWIDPSTPARRILGVDQGAVVSVDEGDSWSSWFNQPTGQFYHVATDTRFPYWVYGAQQDSGAAAVPSRTNGMDAINITQFHELTAGGESDYIAPDPDDPNLIYGGRVDRLDLRTGQTRTIDPTLAYPDVYRRVWTLPLAFSRHGAKRLYFGNQRLFATADGGNHWQVVSPDLTRGEPPAPATLDAPTREDKERPGDRQGVIYAIAPSPLADSLLWAGTDDGLIWKSSDAGRHWRDVTPAAVTPWSKVGVLEASHFSAETAYAAIDRHRLDDDHPYLYRTHDGGAHWQLIVSGIAPEDFVNVVREDPVRQGLLYAGTEHAAYVSLDDGAHWRRLGAGLPATSVRDLAVHGADLVAATHGRAFWILDDVSALRAWNADVAAAPATLLPPSRAYRLRAQGFAGSPMPEDEPRGENPPAGAVIEYYLAHDAQVPVAVTVRDRAGRVVRRFASTDAPVGPDLQKIEIAPRWVATSLPLPTGAGLHRLYWDFRYPAPVALLAKDQEAAGPWAPPGNYRVELKVGDSRTTRELEVLPDPRLRYSAETYAAQFRAAHAVSDLQGRIVAALAAATTLHAALDPLTTDPAVGGQAKALDARLLRVADLELKLDHGNTVGVPATRLEALRALSARAEQLLQAVDGADGPPTADFRRAFAHFQAAASAALAAYGKITGEALKLFNDAPRQSGRAPIAVP
jgi:photosystem II stability/assembly factor-like uncharacterized protein